MKPLSVLVVGDLSTREFERLEPFLRNQANVEVRTGPPGESAGPVDIILLLAARPLCFGEERINALRREHPLARLIQISGPWCYGEGRTGPRPAGVEQMAWFQWPYRLRRILEHSPHLPVTSSLQEQVLTELPGHALPPRGGEVAVWAETAVNFQMFESACRGLGHQVVWIETMDEISAGGGGLVAVWSSQFPPDASAVPPMPKILCLGTPTWEDWLLASSRGYENLLGQPFSLADLAYLLAPFATARESPKPRQ